VPVEEGEERSVRRMNYPAASSGVSKKTHFERNCRVGGGAKRRYPPGGNDGYR